MKTWIASACLALALAAGAAVTPASAHDDKWNGGKGNNDWGWNGGPGWNNGWGWNGGQLPWLGYNNPAWPIAPRNCDDLTFRNGRWTCDQEWRGDKHDKYVSQGFITQQLYAAGYRHIFDIDRDGSRYKVKALDRKGRHVLLTFNARTGDFIKKKYL